MKLLIIFATLITLIVANNTSIQLGINCSGSAMCGGCKQPLGDQGMNDFIKQLSDDATFTDHQYVACKSCHIFKKEGLCVFPQKIGVKTVTGKQVKDAVQRLRDKGCNYCGSAPLFSDDVNDGEITVNYVTNGCVKHGDRIC